MACVKYFLLIIVLLDCDSATLIAGEPPRLPENLAPQKQSYSEQKKLPDLSEAYFSTSPQNLKDGLIDIIVSIRVLDEGVNIPSVERAYILASRRSEREYIQRRGRVLRLSNNKDKAIIYDFVVMGAFSSSKKFNNLHKAEFERVRTFAKDASNKDSLYS